MSAQLRGPAIDVIVESPAWEGDAEAQVGRAISAAATAIGTDFGDRTLAVLLTDDAAIRRLNAQWRDIDKPTNVLSFPADLPAELNLPLLGDIVICSAVVEREAVEQHKVSNAHWAHMVIHGTLHLLGYDHIDDDEAEFMESREIEILSALNFPNPYLSEIDDLPTATSTHQHSTECSTQNHV